MRKPRGQEQINAWLDYLGSATIIKMENGGYRNS
jgi:hypothetical protein